MCAGSALSVHQVRNTFVGNCVGASCTFDECCTENSDGDNLGDNAWDLDDANDKDAQKVLQKLEDALDSYGCVGTGTGTGGANFTARFAVLPGETSVDIRALVDFSSVE
jgi:hypothetical protein